MNLRTFLLGQSRNQTYWNKQLCRYKPQQETHTLHNAFPRFLWAAGKKPGENANYPLEAAAGIKPAENCN